MNKLKTFLYSYIKSLTEPNYYKDIVQAKLSFSLKYYVFFYFILGLLSAVVFSWRDLPELKNNTLELIDQLGREYPEAMVIEMSDYQLQLDGVEQPFGVPFPKAFADDLTEVYEYLIYFDTETNTTEEAALVSLKQSEYKITYPDTQDQVGTYQELEISDFTIDRTTVINNLPTIKSEVSQVLPYTPLGIWFISSVILPIATFIMISITSTFIFIGILIAQFPLKWTQILQISLHTITFAQTAGFLQDLLFHHLNLPSIYFVAYFGATLLALWTVQANLIKKSMGSPNRTNQ